MLGLQEKEEDVVKVLAVSLRAGTEEAYETLLWALESVCLLLDDLFQGLQEVSNHSVEDIFEGRAVKFV